MIFSFSFLSISFLSFVRLGGGSSSLRASSRTMAASKRKGKKPSQSAIKIPSNNVDASSKSTKKKKKKKDKKMVKKTVERTEEIVSSYGAEDKSIKKKIRRNKVDKTIAEPVEQGNKEKECRALGCLTYGLNLPDKFVGKLIDPEKDERDVKGLDPDRPTPEQLVRLQAYATQCSTMGAKGLIDEFETIKRYNIDPFDTTTHSANPDKNRYQDIFCIEPTRVILKDGKPGDYINANYVKGDPFLNDFICTQGPLESTITDFWRMIVQENVGYIVMLCDTIELGKRKCERYIPDNIGETVTYGDVKVTLIDSKIDGHFTNGILAMEVPGKQGRVVYHHQWRNWPDRGVPLTALAGLRVLRHARQTNYSTVVHCSAGVGRTGTLVAIEWLLQTILKNDPPYDMKEMLKTIRNQRAHAIQTAPQYAYIAQAILRKMVQLETPEANENYQKFASDMKALTGPPPPPVNANSASPAP